MKKNSIWLFSAVAVIIIFQICYGLRTLLPGNISWLMTAMHDWGTHYLGWQFYKGEDWHFPLGKIENYYYPVGSNVGFTDSIPLFAIFFKIFKGVLPDDFQYFGIWLFICHLLTAYYTILLLRLFKVNNFIIFLGVIFMVSNPVLVYRGLHPALCAQWLIIASSYLYFLDPAITTPRRILLYQLILQLVAALVNPYLCFMILGFTLIIALKLGFFDKVIGRVYSIVYLALSIVFTLLSWYVIGLVDFSKKEDLGVQGAYGLYSLNLNSLYNPAGYSTFLPVQKQVSWHQYEGFMYLGLGSFLLVFILLIYRIYLFTSKNKQKKNLSVLHTSMIPLLILIILYTLFAITHIVSLNDKILFTVPIPESFKHLGEIFRASARFFWVPYYLIMIFVIIAISRLKIRPAIISSILVTTLAIQLYDIKHLLTSRDLTYGSYQTPLDNKNWTTLINHFDNIAFYPPFEAHQLTNMDYQYFCFLAAKAGKPINIGYVARADGGAMAAYSDSLTAMLEQGLLSPKTLYISTSPHLNHFSLMLQSGNALLNSLDGYFYIYSSQIRNDTVVRLSNELNLKNKIQLDYALDRVKNKIAFTKIAKIPAAENNSIRYAIERINNKEKFVLINGWAFIDSTQNNKGDSIFISLEKDPVSYISATVLQNRPDITSHFHKSYLNDAGFKVFAFFDDLPKGSYRLGIAIKNTRGQFVYQPTDKIVKVGMKEHAEPVKISQLPSTSKISYNFDLFENKNDHVKMGGWATLENQSAEDHEISCVLVNEKDIYRVETDPIKRPDVTAYFKNNYNLDNSGFSVKILKADLNKGKYQVGIIIKDPSSKKEVFMMTDKLVIIP